MVAKKREYLEVDFFELNLYQRIRNSIFLSLVISLLIILGFHITILFSFIIFVILFLLFFFFISSKFSRSYYFVMKKAKLDFIRTIKFKFKDLHKILSYVIICFLFVYTVFLSVFIFIKFSLFNLFTILIFVFIDIVYYFIFFHNDFSYSFCKQGLFLQLLGSPKLFKWKTIKSFKIRNKLIILKFKKVKYVLILPYKKGIEKRFKKFIRV